MKFLYTILISLIILGCSVSDNNIKVNTSEFKQNHVLKDIKIQISPHVNINDIYNSIKIKYHYKIIDNTTLLSSLVFKEGLFDINLLDFQSYLLTTYNIKLDISLYQDTLVFQDTKVNSNKIKNKIINNNEVVFNNIKNQENKENTIVNNEYLKTKCKLLINDKNKYKNCVDENLIKNILKQDLQFNGTFTYEDIFNLLREENIDIEVIIENNDNFYLDTIEDFNGNFNIFFNIIKNKYKYFINIDEINRKIFIKDFNVKYYDLKIPSIQVTPDENLKSYRTEAIKPIKDLSSQIESLLGNDFKFNINYSDSTLYAIGKEKELKILDEIINKFNEKFSVTVSLDLHIYEIELYDNQAFGVNFSSLLSTIGKWQTSLNISNLLTNNLGNLESGDNGGTTTLNQISFDSTFMDSANESKLYSSLLQFLNNFGKTKILTKPTLATINNIPVSLNLSEKFEYVGNVEEKVVTSNNGDNQTIEKETNIEVKEADTGFKLTLLPKVDLDNNSVKIIVRPVISKVKSLTPYNYGTEEAEKQVQLLNMAERDFSTLIDIKNNHTMLIGGYIYEKNEGDKNTIPGLNNQESNGFLDKLFSSEYKQKQRTELLITIKANIQYNH